MLSGGAGMPVLYTSHRGPILSLRHSTRRGRAPTIAPSNWVPGGGPYAHSLGSRPAGLLFSSPRPALAVPINVGGFLAFGVGGGHNVNLAANSRGFTVSGFTDEIAPFVGPFGSKPCLAGEPINVNVVAGGRSISGHATLDGKTYGLGGVDSPGPLNVFLSGSPFFAAAAQCRSRRCPHEPSNFRSRFYSRQ